jgi:hypothetical protein
MAAKRVRNAGVAVLVLSFVFVLICRRRPPWGLCTSLQRWFNRLFPGSSQ